MKEIDRHSIWEVVFIIVFIYTVNAYRLVYACLS